MILCLGKNVFIEYKIIEENPAWNITEKVDKVMGNREEHEISMLKANSKIHYFWHVLQINCLTFNKSFNRSDVGEEK